MWRFAEIGCTEEELYLAGEQVPPGVYQQIGSTREVRLDHEDYLPASLDGHVACYTRVRETWAQLSPYTVQCGTMTRVEGKR